MPDDNDIYGIVGEFVEADELLRAARAAQDAGYTEMDAFSPFPIDGLGEAVGIRKNRVSLATLCGGVFGGSLGYFMLWFINVMDYPLNVGGRPMHSWPAFIPITFELTVLFATFGAVLGMLLFNGLPEPYHPIFNAPNFERASQDRFFLLVEKSDPLYDREATMTFLRNLGPLNAALVTYSGLPGEEETVVQ